MDLKEWVEQWYGKRADEFCRLSRELWEHPELSEHEQVCAQILAAALREAGFTVEMGTAGLPTAFTASYGQGEPKIGFLAEYDALPGLSQAVDTVQSPIEGQACGHGCGHNLLGTGAVAAGIAVKEAMCEQGFPGTVLVYGCPSEEIMLGKIVMTGQQVFDGLDAALSWHPGNYNSASEMSYQAMLSLDYSFHGKASHASMAPEEGQSALDAVELMNVGANYLREHIPAGGQLHYVITNGGEKPNIVPEEASVWYFIRANTLADVQKIRQRLDQIARGAALMTGTQAFVCERTGCSETRIVPAMVRLLYDCMQELALPQWTPKEEAFALEALKNNQVDVQGLLAGNGGFSCAHPLHAGVTKLEGRPIDILGSSDLSDVSWKVPTGMVFTACYPIGMPNHTWGVTACSGMSIGQKGMLYASRTLALAGLRLFHSAQLRRQIRDSYEQIMGAQEYTPAPMNTPRRAL